jgi:hypothetical protein
LIDAVTMDDAKRVARRLYGGGMLVTVGPAQGVGLKRIPGIAPGCFPPLRLPRDSRQIPA